LHAAPAEVGMTATQLRATGAILGDLKFFYANGKLALDRHPHWATWKPRRRSPRPPRAKAPAGATGQAQDHASLPGLRARLPQRGHPQPPLRRLSVAGIGVIRISALPPTGGIPPSLGRQPLIAEAVE